MKIRSLKMFACTLVHTLLLLNVALSGPSNNQNGDDKVVYIQNLREFSTEMSELKIWYSDTWNAILKKQKFGKILETLLEKDIYKDKLSTIPENCEKGLLSVFFSNLESPNFFLMINSIMTASNEEKEGFEALEIPKAFYKFLTDYRDNLEKILDSKIAKNDVENITTYVVSYGVESDITKYTNILQKESLNNKFVYKPSILIDTFLYTYYNPSEAIEKAKGKALITYQIDRLNSSTLLKRKKLKCSNNPNIGNVLIQNGQCWKIDKIIENDEAESKEYCEKIKSHLKKKSDKELLEKVRYFVTLISTYSTDCVKSKKLLRKKSKVLRNK